MNNRAGHAPNQTTRPRPAPRGRGRPPGAAPERLDRVVRGDQRAGRDPDPVVVPAHRRDEQAGQRGREQGGHRVPCGRAGPRRSPRAREDDGRRDPGRPAPWMLPAAGDEAVERLVAGPAGEAGPVALREQAVEPPLARVGGRTAKPSSDGEGEARQAIAACRNFLATSRYGMKISGTSLMPAATPVPNPSTSGSWPVSGWHRSQMISAIRTRLTWPRYMVRSTGSVQKTAAAAEQGHAEPGRSRRVAQAAEDEPQRGQQREDVHRHRQLLGQPPRHERDERRT